MASPKSYTDALTHYRTVAVDAAKLHKQVAQQDRQTRKLLALDAMGLVAGGTINPLTAKPHSWTSAVEAAKDTDHADELTEALLELRYTSELAEIEAKCGWADVLYLVNERETDNA